MTAFLQCVWILSEIGVASIRNLASPFGKTYDPFCTEFPWTNFIHFQKNQKTESRFQIFQIPDPKNVFLGLGTFSKNLPICLPICKCSTNSLWSSTKVDRTYLPVNMTVALSLNILKNTNLRKGYRGNRFCFNCIAYWYCLLAPVIPVWNNSTCFA